MSKYIIDIPKTVGMLEAVGSVHYTYFDGIQCKTIILKSDEIEELNSDYINEHYGQLQDEAYKRGYKDCETRYCSFDACPNRQAEYQRGLDDAWEAARKIMLTPEEGGISFRDLSEIFGCNSAHNCFKYLSASEAIAKLKAYEEKQNDKIEVGDEVMPNNLNKGKKPYIVVSFGTNTACGFTSDGIWTGWELNEITKTGRHFDIEKILKDMRND